MGSSIVYDGKIFLAFQDSTHGTELFVMENESSAPQLVKDINPGTVSSSPYSFVIANNLIFFSAQTEDEGRELWASDGTAAGTNLVEDLEPGAEGSNPTQLTPYANATRVAFRATLSTIGREPCISQGTSATTGCFDIRSGTADSYPEEFTAVGLAVAFAADDDTHGKELWAIAGGMLNFVADINTGSDYSNPSCLFASGSTLYFKAYTPANGYELWRSTGSAAFTKLVRDINPGSDPSNPCNFVQLSPGTILFSAQDGTHGYELWKTDGNPSGTTALVKDIAPGATSSNPNDLIVLGSNMFFTADDGTNGRELWKTDAIVPGGTTELVKDINPGGADSYPDHLVLVGGKLFFRANNGTLGHEPWISDGSTVGTQNIADLKGQDVGSQPYDFAEYNGKAFFFARGDTQPGVYFVDPANPAIQTFTPLLGVGDEGSYLGTLYPISNQYMFFMTDEENTGQEPWSLDITNRTANILADIIPGKDGSSPYPIGAINGLYFFGASDETNGNELWVTDGTQAGTKLFLDLNPGINDSSPGPIGNRVVFNGHLYFTASTPTYGRELWKTDGSIAGTTIVKDFNPGAGDGGPSQLTPALGALYLVADDGTHGTELWKSDGTSANTVLVKDIYPGAPDSIIYNIYEHDSRIFFRADDGINGAELWTSNGTAAGTTLVADLNPGVANAYPSNFFTYGNQLIFSADSPADGELLMSIEAPYSIGSVTILKDPAPGTTIGGINRITDVFGTPLFMAWNDPIGYDLWTTDGTPAGTDFFKIINPKATYSAEISFIRQGGDYFYFGADDGVIGNELWRTDGTPAGTVLVKDMAPGYEEGNPDIYPAHRGALYFAATSPQYGREYWKIVFDECPDDPAKIAMGFCGCGLPDIDSDGDGTLDCSDGCPNDSAKTTAGACGCGQVDIDQNANGIADCLVNQDFAKLLEDAIFYTKLLGKKKKKLAAMGLSKKALKKMIKGLAKQIKNYATNGLSLATTEKSFGKKKNSASKSMKKATKLKSAFFKNLKKKAIRKLKKLKKLQS